MCVIWPVIMWLLVAALAACTQFTHGIVCLLEAGCLFVTMAGAFWVTFYR